MGLLLFFIKKFFVFTFIFAILFLVSEVFRFVRGLNTGDYETSKHRLIWIGVAIAHIITTLFTGFII